MTTYFFNRDKRTGKHAVSGGISAAPHLYLSRKKAAMRVRPDCFEQVEVKLVEVDAQPTAEQVKTYTKTFREFIAVHPDLGEHFAGHAADKLALELAQLAHTLHTSKN